jgi:hypothetical protein
VRKLPDHLPAGAVLDQESVFPRDAGAPGHIGHFDQQKFPAAGNQRHPAIDGALFGECFVGGDLEFIRAGSSGCLDAQQDVAQFGTVAEQLQDRLIARPRPADTEQVFGGGVERLDEQAPVDDNDAGVQVVENLLGRRQAAVATAVSRRPP